MASSEVLIDIVKTAARIRAAELVIAEHYPERAMRCPVHLSLGQEMVATVFGALARREDVFFGNYRSHGHYLAKGGDLFRLFAELLGKREGCSGGMGGSMHVIDRGAGFYGGTAIVSATVPIAGGVAFARKIQARPGVVVSFFGDAAVEEGIVTETANFSMLHQTPMLFVCENNRMCVTTPIELRTPNDNLSTRFTSYGLQGVRVMDQDPLALVAAAEHAYEALRAGKGPQYIEIAGMERWATHVGHEWSGPVHAWWQDPESTAADRCAIAWLVRHMLKTNVVDMQALADIAKAADQEARGAFAAASALADPDPAMDVISLVYASGDLSLLPTQTVGSAVAGNDGLAMPDKLVNPF
ncbi:thiamine pyrophosphate-dependent dehydrogenase E1 component subunit alpha [Patescibacteria group bacterium]|nr:thiamine pyrophosphate-dependent dehydrogenase E1 component subunit alpha [Patescibacteria group bacterium]